MKHLFRVWRTSALVALALVASDCADRTVSSSAAANDVQTSPVRAKAFSMLAEQGEDKSPPAVPGALARPATQSDGRGVDAPVVIITIDGVRWQEIFEGTDPIYTHAPSIPPERYVPRLSALGMVRGAFVGAPGRGKILASGPNYISLPGYEEILSGRPSLCRSNSCTRMSLPSVLDEARSAGAKVAAFASWERLDYAVTTSPGGFMSSCGRASDPAIDPWPGGGDYRPDRMTAAVALPYFEAEKPDVFFLGLGDPDEHAHHNDYDAYIASMRQADYIVGRLIDILDRMGERGKKTHVIITADHGRSYDFKDHGSLPEAARVWMIALGPRFAARGAVASPENRHLRDIAPTLRLVLGLAPDKSERAGMELTELFTPERVPTAL